MDSQLSKFVNLWNYAFQIYFFGEKKTVIQIVVSLSAEIGIPFKISHVYLGNLRYANGKN